MNFMNFFFMVLYFIYYLIIINIFKFIVNFPHHQLKAKFIIICSIFFRLYPLMQKIIFYLTELRFDLLFAFFLRLSFFFSKIYSFPFFNNFINIYNYKFVFLNKKCLNRMTNIWIRTMQY